MLLTDGLDCTREDPRVKALVPVFLDAKAIVVICGKVPTQRSSICILTQVHPVGAGISVSAGIPDFRSKQDVPGIPQLSRRKLKDMFQLRMLANENTPLFAQFISSLAQRAEDSQPTLFHRLLRTLDERGTLVRIYTQNIDGLEAKAGVSTYHRSCSQPGDDQTFRCIPLHGRLQYLYCQSCCAVEKTKPHQDELGKGRFPSCSNCQREETARREAGKRSRMVPKMVPDVVLYDQVHPDADSISGFQIQDLSETQPMDLLLVVGTGMHVIGTQRIIREFSDNIRKNRSPVNLSPSIVYLNLDFKRQNKWESMFDLWIQADCQVVAAAILDALQEEEKANVKRQPCLVDPHEPMGDLTLDLDLESSDMRGNGIVESAIQLLYFHMKHIYDIAGIDGDSEMMKSLRLLELAVSMVAEHRQEFKVVKFHLKRVQDLGKGNKELDLELSSLAYCIHIVDRNT